jgi:hypothetical protein
LVDFFAGFVLLTAELFPFDVFGGATFVAAFLSDLTACGSSFFTEPIFTFAPEPATPPITAPTAAPNGPSIDPAAAPAAAPPTAPRADASELLGFGAFAFAIISSELRILFELLDPSQGLQIGSQKCKSCADKKERAEEAPGSNTCIALI